MSTPDSFDRYSFALNNPWDALKVFRITKETSVPTMVHLLMPHYVRVNAGSPDNAVSIARVEASAHDLKERGIIEPWIARAYETHQEIAP